VGILAEARRMAERTPERRNRAADFFRTVSIALVVFGHWFLIAPHLDRDELRFDLLLAAVPWTQFATWLFQVMPVFFVVGGFANAASWASARREPERRRAWQAGRLRRLLLPTVPLVAVWCIAAAVARRADVPPELVREASQAALVPIWFLAVYIMVTVVVPVSTAAWRRWGLTSVVVLAAAAAAVDLIAFAGEQGWLRWSNYGFVWMAMHQLGYWWHSGRVGTRSSVALLVIGLATLALLVGPLGYPVSMVTVPGAEVSNSRPPTIAMLGMGCVQGGAMLLLAAPVSRWLGDPRRWAVVILAGLMIMTVYLWHIAALISVVGLAMLAGGVRLNRGAGGSGLVAVATGLDRSAAGRVAAVPVCVRRDRDKLAAPRQPAARSAQGNPRRRCDLRRANLLGAERRWGRQRRRGEPGARPARPHRRWAGDRRHWRWPPAIGAGAGRPHITRISACLRLVVCWRTSVGQRPLSTAACHSALVSTSGPSIS